MMINKNTRNISMLQEWSARYRKIIRLTKNISTKAEKRPKTLSYCPPRTPCLLLSWVVGGGRLRNFRPRLNYSSMVFSFPPFIFLFFIPFFCSLLRVWDPDERVVLFPSVGSLLSLRYHANLQRFTTFYI